MRNEVEAAFARQDFLLSNILEVDGPLTTRCWEWQRAIRGDGYGHLTWNYKQYMVHRLTCVLNNGPIPLDLCCLHRCDNPRCCNVDHLFLGTDQDNVDDMMAKGRHNHISHPGEDNGSAVLTKADVANIKGMLSRTKGLGAELARRYGVGLTTVKDISRGRRWAHVEPSPNPVMPPNPDAINLRIRRLNT